MARNFFSFLKVYGLIAIVIAGWWTIAFRPDPLINSLNETICHNSTPPSLNIPLLSTLNREELKTALGGNVALMAKLMRDWDLDAQILESQGMKNAKRLPHADYLRCQLLSRALEQVAEQTMTSCYLPQTFAAASFLLALTSPQEIAALPKKLREQEQLYSRRLTDQIPLDTDRYNSEKLFQSKPKLAFVAHYSHPATLQALENQGIQLYKMNHLSSVPDITQELITVGALVNRPFEAELLKLFMEAALIAIDNRMAALNLHLAKNENSHRVLFLNHYKTYSIPTQRTLTGQLLERIGIPDLLANATEQQRQEWSIPIDKETIVNLNPDCLIIAAENIDTLKMQIYLDPVLNKIPAIQNNRLFFVDPDIQQTPTQYIVLAYHDLIQALAGLL